MHTTFAISIRLSYNKLTIHTQCSIFLENQIQKVRIEKIDYIRHININIYFIEEQRKVDRQLRKAGRDLERDRRELEKQEKLLVCLLKLIIHCTACLYLILGTRNQKISKRR